MKRNYLIILALLVAGAAFWFWNGSRDPADNLDPRVVLRVGNGSEPRELDPATMTGVPESHVADNLFEGLMQYHPQTLEPIPGVAESYTKDGLVYTFKLRTNAKWSDGTPVTAHDFVYSWKRVLSPQLASEYGYQLFYLKNGRAYFEEKDRAKAEEIDLGVEAIDDYTLRVELEKPTPFFLKLLSFHTLAPVPRHVVEKYSGSEWTKPENMVSNGPFALKEWRINRHIRLVRNPHYWNQEKIALQEVFFYPIENQDTEERNFFAGKLDLTNEVPLLKIPEYIKEKAANPDKYHPFETVPMLGIYYYAFQNTKPPLTDKRVRKALSLVIDNTVITDRVSQAGEVPARSFTPETVRGYNPPLIHPAKVDENSIAEAKKLLKEAGYENGVGFPPVDIIFNTSENHKKIAVSIQQMIKQNLGVDIALNNQEWKVFLNTRRNGDFLITRHGWIADYEDPMSFLDLFVTGGTNNDPKYSNPRYDELIRLASMEEDLEKRNAYFVEAETILLNDFVVKPIYTYTNKKLKSEALRLMSPEGEILPYTSNRKDRLLAQYITKVDK